MRFTKNLIKFTVLKNSIKSYAYEFFRQIIRYFVKGEFRVLWDWGLHFFELFKNCRRVAGGGAGRCWRAFLSSQCACVGVEGFVGLTHAVHVHMCSLARLHRPVRGWGVTVLWRGRVCLCLCLVSPLADAKSARLCGSVAFWGARSVIAELRRRVRVVIDWRPGFLCSFEFAPTGPQLSMPHPSRRLRCGFVMGAWECSKRRFESGIAILIGRSAGHGIRRAQVAVAWQRHRYRHPFRSMHWCPGDNSRGVFWHCTTTLSLLVATDNSLPNDNQRIIFVDYSLWQPRSGAVWLCRY